MAGVSRWPLLVAAAVALGAVFPAELSAQFFSFGQNKIQYRRLDWRILRGPHVDLYYYPRRPTSRPPRSRTRKPATTPSRFSWVTRWPSGSPGGLRLPHGFRADQHSSLHASGRAPGCDRFPQASRLLRSEATSPSSVIPPETRAGPRLPARSAERGLLPGAAPQPAQLSPVVDGGHGRAWSGGQDARRDGHARPHPQRPAPAAQGAHLRHQRHRLSARGRDPPLARGYLRRLARRHHVQGAEPARQLQRRAPRCVRADPRSAERRVPAGDAAEVLPFGGQPRPLSVLGREVAKLAVKPTFLPDTNGGSGGVLYVSPAGGYVTIYNRGLDGGHARTVVTGGRSAEMESFHPFDSKMDASPGRTPPLRGAVRRPRRADHLGPGGRQGAGPLPVPRAGCRCSRPTGCPTVAASWSAASRRAASPTSTACICPDGTLEPLTADRYQDLDPTPGPEGRRIVFASDRAADGLRGPPTCSC